MALIPLWTYKKLDEKLVVAPEDVVRYFNKSLGDLSNYIAGLPLYADSDAPYNTGFGFEVFKAQQGLAGRPGTEIGISNAMFGYQAGKQITSGYGNSGFGATAFLWCTSGAYNSGFGVDALYTLIDGYSNCAFGADALGFLDHGYENCAFGFDTLFLCTGGSRNAAFGFRSFKSLLTGTNNVGLGAFAGAYELGSNTLYINNVDWVNTATEISNSLVVGLFAAAPSLQRFRINANMGIQGPATSTSPLNIQSLPTSAAGLVAGDVWNSAGTLKVA